MLYKNHCSVMVFGGTFKSRFESGFIHIARNNWCATSVHPVVATGWLLSEPHASLAFKWF